MSKKRISTEGLSVIELDDTGYDFESKTSGILIDAYFNNKTVSVTQVPAIFKGAANWYIKNDTLLKQIKELKPDLLVLSIILKVIMLMI